MVFFSPKAHILNASPPARCNPEQSRPRMRIQMTPKLFISLPILFCISLSAQATPTSQSARWPEKAANEWYAKQPWLVGSNYIPATAINELEMWQARSFQPPPIELQLRRGGFIDLNT